MLKLYKKKKKKKKKKHSGEKGIRIAILLNSFLHAYRKEIQLKEVSLSCRRQIMK